MPEPAVLPLQRLPKQTLHHAWAPKLGRTIVLNSLGQLRLWALLEAHPGVTRYCERPAWPDDEEPSPCPDFWALRDGTPIWLALAPAAGDEEPAPAEASRVQLVTADAAAPLAPAGLAVADRRSCPVGLGLVAPRRVHAQEGLLRSPRRPRTSEGSCSVTPSRWKRRCHVYFKNFLSRCHCRIN